MRRALWSIVSAFLLVADRGVRAADDAPITREQFLLLQRQNQELQEQLKNQQQMIDSLVHKVADIQAAGAPRGNESGDTKIKPEDQPLPADSAASFHLGKVDITGEGGLAFFSSQSQGQFPHSTFRIDEARLFFEAPVWNDVYFFSEVDLASRESTSLALTVAELYLDFEDVSKLWDRERMLNIRVGQFYIPFGEEYLQRFAIDNPLISHSVSDIWGVDAGVELYGKVGPVKYVAAVMNGGYTTTQSLQGDKSVAAKIGYDPAKWVHLSASGMRTGDLNIANGISAQWFGNGWFRSLGSAPATSAYHVNLVEGDAVFWLPFADLKAAGGYIDYGDDNQPARNHRDVYYYYLEGVHNFTRQFYGAARFSEVFAHQGFPIVGNSTQAKYLFGPLTTEYWRLSLGLGYRFSPNLLVKGEYSFNQGRQAGGAARTDENQFSLEAAFKF